MTVYGNWKTLGEQLGVRKDLLDWHQETLVVCVHMEYNKFSENIYKLKETYWYKVHVTKEFSSFQ